MQKNNEAETVTYGTIADVEDTLCASHVGAKAVNIYLHVLGTSERGPKDKKRKAKFSKQIHHRLRAYLRQKCNIHWSQHHGNTNPNFETKKAL